MSRRGRIYTQLWDVKLAWYFLTVNHRIYLSNMEYSLRIHNFSPSWLCLIFKILPTWTNFLEPSGYSTVINLNNLVTVQWSTWTIWLLYSDQLEPSGNSIDYVALSSVQFPNHTRCEAMYYMSTYQQVRYYQLQRVPPTAWTASIY